MNSKLIEYKINKVFLELNSIDDDKLKILRFKQVCLNKDQELYLKDNYMNFVNVFTIMVLDYEGYFDECINVLMRLLEVKAFNTLIKKYPDIMRLISLDKQLTPEYGELQNYDIFMIHMVEMYKKVYSSEGEDCNLLKTYFEEGRNEILEMLKSLELIN